MKIDYLANTLGNFNDYVIVNYCASVRCEDDGAHFPLYAYNGFILLKEDDINKSDDEFYEMAIADLKNKYKDKNRITLDEQLDDPAFEYINVQIQKEFFNEKYIKITR